MDEIDELIEDLIREVHDDAVGYEWGTNRADIEGACQKLQDAINAQLPRWIPVSEQMPEPNKPVIGLSDGPNPEVFVMTRTNFNCWLTNNFITRMWVTHWMPIPTLPEVTK